MTTALLLIGILIILWGIKTALYYDDETHRFIPKSEEKDYEKKIEKGCPFDENLYNTK